MICLLAFLIPVSAIGNSPAVKLADCTNEGTMDRGNMALVGRTLIGQHPIVGTLAISAYTPTRSLLIMRSYLLELLIDAKASDSLKLSCEKAQNSVRVQIGNIRLHLNDDIPLAKPVNLLVELKSSQRFVEGAEHLLLRTRL